MLKPTKFSHPDKTVIAVATVLLGEISKKRVMKYDELFNQLKKACEGVESLFLPAINLLYLLGTIEYLKKIDSFEYIG